MNRYQSTTFIFCCLFYGELLYHKLSRFNFSHEVKTTDLEGNIQTIRISDDEIHCGPFMANSTITPLEEVGILPEYDSVIQKVFHALTFNIGIYLTLYLTYKNQR